MRIWSCWPIMIISLSFSWPRFASLAWLVMSISVHYIKEAFLLIFTEILRKALLQGSLPVDSNPWIWLYQSFQSWADLFLFIVWLRLSQSFFSSLSLDIPFHHTWSAHMEQSAILRVHLGLCMVFTVERIEAERAIGNGIHLPNY